MGSLKPEKAIPDAILRQAKGLAIITVAKVGMMVTYNIGTGLVVARRQDGSWSPPSAISSLGIGWGAQVGLFSGMPGFDFINLKGQASKPRSIFLFHTVCRLTMGANVLKLIVLDNKHQFNF